MDKELATFNKRCPIHSFYLNQEKFFKDLSLKTGGQAEKFDVNDKNASESLTEFVVCQILKLIQ